LTYILPLTVCVYLHSNFSGGLREWRFGRSRSSKVKVIDFGGNQKRVCNFLLIRHSNLGHILDRFRDIVRFCAPEWPNLYSTLIWGCSRCTRSPMLGSMWAEALRYSTVKLFLKYSNLCDHWSRYLNVTDSRTDKRVDIHFCACLCMYVCIFCDSTASCTYITPWAIKNV